MRGSILRLVYRLVKKNQGLAGLNPTFRSFEGVNFGISISVKSLRYCDLRHSNEIAAYGFCTMEPLHFRKTVAWVITNT